MGFMLPPTSWEVRHAAGIFQGSHYLAAHGDLPDTPMWRFLERRFDLDEGRFARWHPNAASLIRESRLKTEQGGGDVLPPVVSPPTTPLDPPPQTACVPISQAIPEPNSLVLSLIAVAASLILWRKFHV